MPAVLQMQSSVGVGAEFHLLVSHNNSQSHDGNYQSICNLLLLARACGEDGKRRAQRSQLRARSGGYPLAGTTQLLEEILIHPPIPETLPDRVLEKMKAPAKEEDVPVIRPEQLAEADGFIFGFPSRFGMMGAQFIAFFESTYLLWASQKLAGKPAGVFWSTGFHGGGQENSALTTITQLANHGILFVPLGYTFGSGMFEINEVRGGSSYGAGTYAGDGSREPTQLELQQAFYQGKYIAEIAQKLKVHSH